MTNNRKETDRFRDYLLGKLSPEQSGKLSDELKNDDAKRNRLEDFRGRHERAALALEMKERRDKQLDAISHLSPEEQIRRVTGAGKKSTLYRYLSAAAAAIVLLIASYQFLQTDKIEAGPYAVEAADERWERTDFGTERGNLEDAWGAALSSYNLGDDDGVVTALESVDERSPQMNQMLADAYFSKAQFTRSAELYDQVVASGNDLKYEAEWKSILAYLSTETGFKFAREKLDKLIKTGTSVYIKDAKELRKNLTN